jgi:hypothetical protein
MKGQRVSTKCLVSKIELGNNSCDDTPGTSPNKVDDKHYRGSLNVPCDLNY